jgi:tol-pal system protein YbgF
MRISLAALLLVFTGANAVAQAPVVDLNSQSSTPDSTQTVPEIQAPIDIESRLAILERKDSNRIEAQQRIQSQLDLLQSEVDDIRGTIELHNHQLEKILQRQRELYLELDNRFNALRAQTDVVENNIANSADNTGAQTGEQTNNTPLDPTGGVSDGQAYQMAVDLILKQRDYENAIPAFENFLTNYPASSFTDNAHYWLGQLLFNKQDWEGARNQFLQVVENFLDSTKRADALYKLGMLEKTESNTAQAKTYFEQVIAEYAGTTSARLATQQLNSL